jgi:PIN domain nuclease of toxin-antitoxin system
VTEKYIDMWRYNFRNGPNYPWREATARVEIEPSQSLTENSSDQIASTSSQLESAQESMYDRLDVRKNSTSYLRTTRNESAVSCFELEHSDIMSSLNMTHGMDRAPFTGSTTSGPSLAHLEQDF